MWPTRSHNTAAKCAVVATPAGHKGGPQPAHHPTKPAKSSTPHYPLPPPTCEQGPNQGKRRSRGDIVLGQGHGQPPGYDNIGCKITTKQVGCESDVTSRNPQTRHLAILATNVGRKTTARGVAVLAKAVLAHPTSVPAYNAVPLQRAL
uniref:Uncharacterized protein n=1 Tax=Eutreptiella gymnastica TaxID=73025 RepID=A0A7S4G3P0_9EUGL|mmetsp:Transcript_44150/g.71777  ORF Transcript_44150/g.71777 Transcript_44150/m.71777 type:complete len:148 (-) Transcript_44150:745-1188(-)